MTRPVHGGNLTWAAAVAGCPPSAILDFSASVNPLGPPESAIRAIQAHLSSLRAYPDPDYHQLRLAFSQLHSPLDPDWVLPGNGAAELLTWAALDLSQLDATCLVTPAFGDYRRALKTFGATVLECPLEFRESVAETRLDLEILGSYLGTEGQWADRRIGLLLNNPHNPTGLLWNQDVMRSCLEQFSLVVADEAFMDFLLPSQQESWVSLVCEFPNLVILRSLTKFYSLPGLRLGYAIAHPDRLHRWQQWRDPWPVNALAAAAAVAVLSDTAFQQRTFDWLLKARPQLFHGLAQLPGLTPYPGVANFLLVHSDRAVPELQKRLLERDRILIRDCLSFPELGDRYFRVAVRTEAENQRLLDALSAILSEG